MSESNQALQILKDIVPHLIPWIIALVITSLVVLVSNSFMGLQKILFQSTMFGLGLAGSVSYIMANNGEDLKVFWSSFVSLNQETKFCLATITIVAAYFGGALYVASPDRPDSVVANSLATPASCDICVTFDIPTVLPVDDKDFFDQFLDKLCNEIIADLPTLYEMPEEAVSWVRRMLKYTVAGGKMNRGLSLMAVQQTFAEAHGRTLSNRERCQSAALGWCVEFLQAFFLVADDVMDDSVTRRGQPCWFRLHDVKLISINDSFLLESCVYKILKKYFGSEAYYPQLVDLFIEVTRQTELGQLLDLTSQPLGGPIDLTRFTLERYTSIVKYKTAFYSFYLPVALGMIVSGITDPHSYATARKILLIMGEYFQIQDDYLDCYGAPEVIGKVGTDIQDNKCSWLVVQALDRVTPKQRRVLEENYGQHDLKKVAKVKKLYEELDLAAVFAQYEEQSYKEIQALLAQISDIPSEVFQFLLRKIYKRSK